MPIPRWESLSNVRKTNLRLALIGLNESVSHGPFKSESFREWMPIPRLGQMGREDRGYSNESVSHGPFKSESFREWRPIPRWESLSNVRKTNLRLALIGQNESVSHGPFKSQSFREWMPIPRLGQISREGRGHSNELVSHGPFKNESFREWMPISR
jgi:hypothetical protein